jgi:hypothetical protein
LWLLLLKNRREGKMAEKTSSTDARTGEKSKCGRGHDEILQGRKSNLGIISLFLVFPCT